TSARYGSRIAPEQKTDLIFGLLDLTLSIRYGHSCSVNQLLSLSRVQQRPDPALQLKSDQTERFRSRGQSVFCNLQFQIQFEKAEIGGGHVADQGRDDGLSRPVRT